MFKNKILLGRILNTLLFYIGWVYAAYEAAKGNAWSGTLFILIITIVHLCFVSNVKKEIILIVGLSLLGTLIDTTFILTGFIHYNAGYPSLPWLAPPWITAMWMLFATTINHAFESLQSRPILSAILGACGGTFTYVGAINYGSANFLVDPVFGMAVLAVVWAVLFPLILRVSTLIAK